MIKIRIVIKIVVVSCLIFSACSEIGHPDYKYIETIMQTNLQKTEPKEIKPFIIKAESDSLAYVKAYLNFCISRKLYNEEFQKSGAIAGRPISFRLLNDQAIDISRSVTFLNKDQVEKSIEERVNSFRSSKK